MADTYFTVRPVGAAALTWVAGRLLPRAAVAATLVVVAGGAALRIPDHLPLDHTSARVLVVGRVLQQPRPGELRLDLGSGHAQLLTRAGTGGTGHIVVVRARVLRPGAFPLLEEIPPDATAERRRLLGTRSPEVP